MSDIRANTISDTSGNGPINLHKRSAAKAWASVNNSMVVQDSFNLASMTDVATGSYGYNVSSTMSNVFYSATGSKQNDQSNDGMIMFNQSQSTASKATFNNYEYGDTLVDPRWAVATIHGDLA